jgi:hypothetical protein
MSAGRTLDTSSLCSGTRCIRAGGRPSALMPRGGAGCARPATAVPSASAFESGTPARSRPIAANAITTRWPGLAGCAFMTIGVQISLSRWSEPDR